MIWIIFGILVLLFLAWMVYDMRKIEEAVRRRDDCRPPDDS